MANASEYTLADLRRMHRDTIATVRQQSRKVAKITDKGFKLRVTNHGATLVSEYTASTRPDHTHGLTTAL